MKMDTFGLSADQMTSLSHLATGLGHLKLKVL